MNDAAGPRGTSPSGEAAVFEFHGKRLVYSKTSLFLFDERSRARAACVRVVTHPWFDRLVLLVILLNSVVLALVDWSVVDEDPGSEQVGEPVAEGSWRNALLYRTEGAFTALFSLEFALKVVAQGFVLGRGAYMRDAWNIIDFVVVATALMASVPGMPKTSAVRVFRVLRPLRSISALPGLQHLVVSLLRSVPQLMSVIVLLLFVFVVFGIFGIQFFAGKQHSRCRLTPYPVTTAFEVRGGRPVSPRVHSSVVCTSRQVPDSHSITLRCSSQGGHSKFLRFTQGIFADRVAFSAVEFDGGGARTTYLVHTMACRWVSAFSRSAENQPLDS